MKNIVFLFLCVTAFSYSQNIKSTQRIKYKSLTEEAIHNRFIKDSTDFHLIKSLMVIDSSYTEEQIDFKINDLDDFILPLAVKIQNLSNENKIKLIYKSVHDKYLRKYKIEAFFPEIFSSGQYNCLTATALYSYVFDKINIPYQIKETPTHVYLIAYPNAENIYIETTLPGEAGSFIISDKLTKESVDELVKLKLIDAQRLVEVGYSKAYEEYFYGDQNAKKTELVGIQYYNKMVIQMGQLNLDLAYQNALKSEVYYKSQRLSFLKKSIASHQVDNVLFTNIDNFYWFVEFANLTDDFEFLYGKLYRIISSHYPNTTNLEKIKNSLEDVVDIKLRNKLYSVYYLFHAEKELDYQKEKTALKYAEKAYEFDSENINSQNIISRCATKSMVVGNISQLKIKEMELMVKKYPFIEQFGTFNAYKGYVLCILISMEFSKNNSTLGNKYLNELNTLVKKYKNEIDFDHSALGAAYGEIGAFYYRQKQYNVALRLLNEGNVLSPNNEQILRKIKFVKSALK
ncbi:hypothetical protein [Flavobacterium sp. UBA7680]|uniref:hypothetical protein n=1 Tax=Flavobacterium sp. UBA7680 TaxID=1946559 RepID=UPI0025BF7C60|nr:hypothetical protein [Flavobacterium sp. UBA7680]